MARRRWLALLTVAMLAALAAVTYAAARPDGPRNPPNTKQFKAELNGFNETPSSISSTGWGEFRAKLVDDTTLHYVFTYHDLEGGASLFAHVHFGARYQTAGVSFFLCGGSTKPTPCPNVSGNVEGDVTPADVVGPNG